MAGFPWHPHRGIETITYVLAGTVEHGDSLGNRGILGPGSLQLWAVPPAGTPRSLGVLGEGRLLRLTAAERELQAAPALAVSLEPRGGVPGDQGPTGPVLFIGRTVRL